VVIEQFRSGSVPSPYLQPLTDLPGRSLSRLVGPVAAYNVLVLATFPLSAVAAYLLARRVVGSPLGAMVAALAYAFLPFHVTQAAGHPHIAQTQWLPLYFLALWRCVDHPDLPRAALLVAAAAATALSDFYAGFIAAALSPVAVLAYGVLSPDRPRETQAAITALASLIPLRRAGLELVLIHHVAPAVLLRPGSLAFARSELFAWSAKWWSYLVPPVEHPLLGSSVRAFWARRGLDESLLEHQQVGVGWSLLVLGTVPLWLWLRGDRASLAVRSAPVLVIVALAALLCSLSPERRIGSFTFVSLRALLYGGADVPGLPGSARGRPRWSRCWRSRRRGALGSPSGTARRAAAVPWPRRPGTVALPPWRWRDVPPPPPTDGSRRSPAPCACWTASRPPGKPTAWPSPSSATRPRCWARRPSTTAASRGSGRS
jgi:hypothetical protein